MLTQCACCASTGRVVGMGGFYAVCNECEGRGVIDEALQTEHKSYIIDSAIEILEKKVRGRPKKIQSYTANLDD